MLVKIEQLVTYPVKSCAGITVNRSEINASGLKWDRQWVVVDSNGIKLTQRSLPNMVLIQPTLTATHLCLDAPGMPRTQISLNTAVSAAVSVQIWDDRTFGNDQGDGAASWLSHFLGISCRLLRVHPNAQRGLHSHWIRQWLKTQNNPQLNTQQLSTTHFGFADGFPFLICNQSSLDELNAEIQQQGTETVSMNRFRPNIVISGLEAYDEDYVISLEGNGHYFAKLKNCTRCPMPNVDPITANVGTQPGLALVKTRRTNEGILFGINAALYQADERGWIEVGQVLQVEMGF